MRISLFFLPDSRGGAFHAAKELIVLQVLFNKGTCATCSLLDMSSLEELLQFLLGSCDLADYSVEVLRSTCSKTFNQQAFYLYSMTPIGSCCLQKKN